MSRHMDIIRKLLKEQAAKKAVELVLPKAVTAGAEKAVDDTIKGAIKPKLTVVPTTTADDAAKWLAANSSHPKASEWGYSIKQYGIVPKELEDEIAKSVAAAKPAAPPAKPATPARPDRRRVQPAPPGAPSGPGRRRWDPRRPKPDKTPSAPEKPIEPSKPQGPTTRPVEPRVPVEPAKPQQDPWLPKAPPEVPAQPSKPQGPTTRPKIPKKPKPETKPETKPQPAIEPKPAPVPETKPQPVPETKPQPVPKPAPVPETKPQPITKPEPKPEPILKPEPKPEPILKPEPKPEPKEKVKPKDKVKPPGGVVPVPFGLPTFGAKGRDLRTNVTGTGVREEYIQEQENFKKFKVMYILHGEEKTNVYRYKGKDTFAKARVLRQLRERGAGSIRFMQYESVEMDEAYMPDATRKPVVYRAPPKRGEVVGKMKVRLIRRHQDVMPGERTATSENTKRLRRLIRKVLRKGKLKKPN